MGHVRPSSTDLGIATLSCAHPGQLIQLCQQTADSLPTSPGPIQSPKPTSKVGRVHLLGETCVCSSRTLSLCSVLLARTAALPKQALNQLLLVLGPDQPNPEKQGNTGMLCPGIKQGG